MKRLVLQRGQLRVITRRRPRTWRERVADWLIRREHQNVWAAYWANRLWRQ